MNKKAKCAKVWIENYFFLKQDSQSREQIYASTAGDPVQKRTRKPL